MLGGGPTQSVGVGWSVPFDEVAGPENKTAGARPEASRGGLGGEYDRAPTADEIHWQLKGLCRHHDPKLWTPNPPEVEAKSMEAKKICRQCPVLAECREWALDHRETYGVWGGLSEGDRDKILSGRAHERRDHQKVAGFYATGT